MRIFSDCLPCMLRQVLEATNMVTNDEDIHEKIMDEAIQVLANHRQYSCAPELCAAMHQVVRKHTGEKDPYAKIKADDIRAALKIEPLIKDFVGIGKGNEILMKALKASATGNIMDSAIYSSLDIEACVMEEIQKPFAISHEEEFIKDITTAKTILMIADNAGEVLFDKLLAKYLSQDYKVVYAVRGEPIINDTTIEDALKTGIQEYVEIISTGCGMPGAVLKSCSSEFKEVFDAADVVISKGQGNFEALSEAKRSIYFLLKAKCPQIAEALDVELGKHVFLKR